MNPNPSCVRDDCKFSQSSDQISENMNSSLINCVTCSKSWTAITRDGKTVYSETK